MAKVLLLMALGNELSTKDDNERSLLFFKFTLKQSIENDQPPIANISEPFQEYLCFLISTTVEQKTIILVIDEATVMHVVMDDFVREGTIPDEVQEGYAALAVAISSESLVAVFGT